MKKRGHKLPFVQWWIKKNNRPFDGNRIRISDEDLGKLMTLRQSLVDNSTTGNE